MNYLVDAFNRQVSLPEGPLSMGSSVRRLTDYVAVEVFIDHLSYGDDESRLGDDDYCSTDIVEVEFAVSGEVSVYLNCGDYGYEGDLLYYKMMGDDKLEDIPDDVLVRLAYQAYMHD